MFLELSEKTIKHGLSPSITDLIRAHPAFVEAAAEVDRQRGGAEA
jgi:hypothetical protein